MPKFGEIRLFFFRTKGTYLGFSAFFKIEVTHFQISWSWGRIFVDLAIPWDYTPYRRLQLGPIKEFFHERVMQKIDVKGRQNRSKTLLNYQS